MIGVFNSIDHTIPHNQGSFRRIHVLLRDGCVVGIPRHPASCSAATTNLANRVVNIVQRSMAEIGPGIGLAEVGTGFSPSEAVVSGVDPRHGTAFVNQLFTGPNGGAGGPDTDGWLTMSDLGSGGSLLLDSVEIDEMKQPLVVHERRLVPDSEGAGRHRGAPSLHVEYGPIGCAIEALYANDGAVNATAGAQGGEGGAPSAQHRRRVDGTLEEIDAWGPVTIAPGERMVAQTAGGGGYGPPTERDPAAVERDVAEGWVSPDRAAEVYGTSIQDGGDR
jgi:N-methylhydantoinase B